MSENLRARIYSLYSAYAKGRLDFVLNFFDDNAEFISYAPVDVFPYLGRRKGKSAIAEVMKTAQTEFEYLTYLPIFVVAEKTDAGVIVQVRLRQRSTDRIIHSSLSVRPDAIRPIASRKLSPSPRYFSACT